MEPSGLEAQDDSEVDIYLASEDELGSFMAEHDETLSVCDDFERTRAPLARNVVLTRCWQRSG